MNKKNDTEGITEGITMDITQNSPSHSSNPKESLFQAISADKLSNLMHTLVHDIGNPMTSIISYSGLIEQGPSLSLSTEQLSPYAGKITKESWRVMKLIDLLLLSISERKEVSSFSLQSAKQTIIQRSSSRYDLGEADLLLKGFDTEKLVKGDLDQFVLLACEIISNALGAYVALRKNAPDDSDEDGCTVIIEAEIKNETIVFNFTNPSPKHSKDLSLLFELANSEFSRNNKPAGIGLFSLARTIHRWGGEVSISENATSENLNQFSTKISLPLVEIKET